MRALHGPILGVILLLAGCGGSDEKVAEVTCASFSTRAAAQLYFQQHPAATQLDGDNDGLACEALP